MARRKDNRVPYKDLEEAKSEAERRFPGAAKYHAMLHDGNTLVEVWDESGHAKVHRIELVD